MSKQIPDVKFVIRPEKEFIKITSDDIFKDKVIVLFAVPGAFTPTCNLNFLFFVIPGKIRPEICNIILNLGVYAFKKYPYKRIF